MTPAAYRTSSTDGILPVGRVEIKNRFSVIFTADGVVRIALLNRVLSERYVLEIEHDRVSLSYEGKTSRKRYETFALKTGDIITADVWARVRLR